MKKVSLQSLGMCYNVFNRYGEILDTIRVIEYEELCNYGIDLVHYDDIYFQDSFRRKIETFKGFVETPMDISMYCSYYTEFDLMDAVNSAMVEKNKIVVVYFYEDFGDAYSW